MAEEVSECSICGTELEEGVTECPECGEPLEGKELSECPICGSEVEEGAIECSECGELLEEDEDKKKVIEQLTNISGLGRKRAIKLYEEGFKDPEDIVEEGMEGLAGIEGIGVKTASEMIDEAEELIEEEEEDIEEPLEGIDEDEEEGEFLESITEDFHGMIEEEEELVEGPKRVILGDNIRENLGDLIPVLSAFLIPVFLLILVASELVVALLYYNSIFPAHSLHYLTPSPFIFSSWIASIILSFLIVLALFILTWSGYDFNTIFRLKVNKSMLLFSALISIIISISLLIHVYYSQMYSGISLTFALLGVSLFMLATQLELLRKSYSLFPRIEEKKTCMECGGVIDLYLENCPQCSSKISVLEEKISKVEKGVVWISIVPFFQKKFRRVPGVSEDMEVTEAKEEVPEWEEIPEPPEEIPEPPEEIPEPEEEIPEPPEEIPEPEEEIPEWEEVPEPPEEVPEPPEEVPEPEEEIPEWEEVPELEEEVPEPEEEIPEWEEVPELEEEVPEPEEEIPEWEEVPELEEEVPEPEEEGVISKRLSGLADSIRRGWSSTVSFFQNKLRRGSKAPEEEEVLEPKEELPEWEEEISEPEEEVPEPEEEVIREEIPEPEEEVIEEEELEPEEEVPEPEEEVIEEEEEIPEWEEELPEPEEEGGISKRLSGLADSIRRGWSSAVSFFRTKLTRGPKATEKETVSEGEFEKFEGIEAKGICPDCGALISVDSEECPECGEELEPSEKEEEEERELEELEKTLEDLEEETKPIAFVCPICDAEFEDDVDECPVCGTAFVEEEGEEEEEGLVEGVLKENQENEK